MKKLFSECSECGVSVYKKLGAISDSWCFEGTAPVNCKKCGIRIKKAPNDALGMSEYRIQFKDDPLQDYPITPCEEPPKSAPGAQPSKKSKIAMIVVGLAVAALVAFIAYSS